MLLIHSPSRLLAAAADTELLALLIALAVLIAGAKVMGSLSVRIGQPAVLGELMAGLLFGPTFLNLLNWPLMGGERSGEVIHLLGQLGVLWLMFAAGLEVELTELRRSGRPASLAGVFGVVGPIAMGLGLALAFGLPQTQAIFLGITLSATSVSISAQTLLELGRLRSREGIALLGAAVIDDVLVIVSLSLFVVAVSGEGDATALVAVIGRMAVVLVAVSVLAMVVLPRLVSWAQRLRASEGVLAIVLASVLLLAWATEYLGGVAAITGAFLAGLGLGRSHLREEIEHGLHRLAYAFFVPLFLVDIGLQANLRVLDTSDLLFAVLVIIVAIVSKVVGSGLGARLGGFEWKPAFRMGLGMISRGEVGLIVAGVGVTSGILESGLFSIIVLMVLVTTLATPLLLRWAFSGEEARDVSTGHPGHS